MAKPAGGGGGEELPAKRTPAKHSQVLNFVFSLFRRVSLWGKMFKRNGILFRNKFIMFCKLLSLLFYQRNLSSFCGGEGLEGSLYKEFFMWWVECILRGRYYFFKILRFPGIYGQKLFMEIFWWKLLEIVKNFLKFASWKT